MGITKFFLIKKNRRILIALIILGLLSIIVLVSWFFWKKHQTNLEYDSLLEYENVMNFINVDQPQTLIDAEKFVENNKNIYGVLASLRVVQYYISKNELQKAADQLQQDLTRLKDNNLKTVVGLRLARIQIQQKKPNQALKVLNLLKEGSFSCLISDIRGEALLKNGDKKNAYHAWETCIKNNSLQQEEFKAIIHMKANSLSSLLSG